MNHSDIKSKILAFIKKNFLLGADTVILGDDESFIEKGIIDSTGVLELVTFIEETFNFKVNDEELIPSNLDSLNKLTTFVGNKTEPL
jgi:acyl carrier protein